MRGWSVFTILLAGIWLSGCVPSNATWQADPAALRATAQAAEALARQAEEHAQAVQLTQAADIRRTAEAVSLVVTQQAIAVEATRQALLLAEQTYRLTATAEAIQQQAEQEAHIRQRDELMQWFVMAILLVILLALGGVAILLVWKAGTEWIAWQSRRRQLVESRAGTLLLLAENAPPVRVQVIQPSLPPVVREEDETESELEPIPYSVNGRLVGFIHRQSDPQRRLVMRLLRESIQAVGAQSNRIPGWRELGWSAETWTTAIRLLWRYVETQPGKGTYLTGEYQTLQDLYFAVGEKRAILSPTPIEES